MAAAVTDRLWEVVGLGCRLGVIPARGGRKERANEKSSAVGERDRSVSNVSYESMGKLAAIFRYAQSSARVPVFSIVLPGGMGLAIIFSFIGCYIPILRANDPS